MTLFIQIRNGQPYEHPILADNFQQAFPHIDTNNLPPEFAYFERVDCPRAAGVYEVDVVSYEWVDGIVKDVWSVRPMTAEEKTAKQAELNWFLQKALEHLKDRAQNLLEKAKTDEAKQVFQTYINQLDAFVCDDPAYAVIPHLPRLADDGTALSNTAPGAVPDVTG